MIGFEYRDAAMNMALDEAVMEGLAAGSSVPTVRFYGWRPSAVSIGRFQSLKDEVDVDLCRTLHIDVVRRRTGGGAVLHSEVGEITYSVLAPEALMPKDINEAYRSVCGEVIDALAMLGVRSQFSPINDVIVGGRKISGSAQTRRQGVFLQHGTLLLHVEPDLMFTALKVSDAKVREKAVRSARERVTALDHHSGASRADALVALTASFMDGKDWQPGDWLPAEIARAEELVRTRYANDDWTFER